MRIPNGLPAAVAVMTGGGVSGIVRFYQASDGVLIKAEIDGLPQTSECGFFGFHIHEGTSCTGVGFADTGGHYNPGGTPHPQHGGDLPPLLSANGKAFLAVLTDRFRIADVLGRTVVIHSDPDDFHTQPAGNAGNKIACGVIRRFS